jgi:hypothetical protein
MALALLTVINVVVVVAPGAGAGVPLAFPLEGELVGDVTVMTVVLTVGVVTVVPPSAGTVGDVGTVAGVPIAVGAGTVAASGTDAVCAAALAPLDASTIPIAAIDGIRLSCIKSSIAILPSREARGVPAGAGPEARTLQSPSGIVFIGVRIPVSVGGSLSLLP